MGTSSGRLLIVFSIILLQLFLATPINLLGQKTYLQQKVSISVSNKPIADVLDKLSDNYGVRFTYDPDNISAEKLISLKVNNMPLSDVLSKIFGDNTIVFRENGSQVIIFRDRSVKDVEPSNSLVPKEKAAIAPISYVQIAVPDQEKPAAKSLNNIPVNKTITTVPDTLYIIHRDTVLKLDTVFKVDTLFLIKMDTLIQRDTVFYEVKNLQMKEPDSIKDRGFFADFSGSYLLSNMILSASESGREVLLAKLKTTGNQNLPGYCAGAGLGYHLKRWTLRSGVYYTRFLQNFKYAYEHQTGGYFETDTIEKYYTLTGLDTSWFYITDSSWLEKQVKQYNYKIQNRFSYIEIPLSLSYSIYHRKFDLYLTGGLIAGIMPSAIGSIIDPVHENEVTSLDKIQLNTFILSVTGGSGVRFAFNKHSGIFSEVTYRQQLSSLYKDYPVSAKFGTVSFRLGITCNF